MLDSGTMRSCSSGAMAAASIWDIEELTANVLRWLPPASLLTARLVCTQWNRIVVSQRSHISTPCSYLAARGQAQLFDPALRAWVRVSVPRPLVPSAFLKVVRSEGNHGLVAVQEFYAYELRRTPCFWVGNPMTNAWKLVPGGEAISPDNLGCACFQFVVLSEGPPARYKIVGFGLTRALPPANYCIVTYDSATEAWTPGARFPDLQRTPYPPRRILLPESLQPTFAAHRDGRIVFLNNECYGGGEVGMQVYSYDLEEDRFRVMVDATEGADEIDTHGAVFLPGEALPALIAFHRWGPGPRVRLYRFRRCEGRWRLEESSQLSDLKVIARMVPMIPQDDTGKYFYQDSVQTGDDEHHAFNVVFNRQAQCVAFPAPELAQEDMRLGSKCTFYPRFDMRP